MEIPQPQNEHLWLQRLVGDWTFEAEMIMGPDQPPATSSGRESVRSLGGLWTIGEGSNVVPEGDDTIDSIMTLGYDPALQRFVGTFVTACMTYLWTYNGTLDPSGTTLTLSAEGPSFGNDNAMTQYQDIIEFADDDHRTLSSQLMGPDGKWLRFMTARYTRR